MKERSEEYLEKMKHAVLEQFKKYAIKYDLSLDLYTGLKPDKLFKNILWEFSQIAEKVTHRPPGESVGVRLAWWTRLSELLSIVEIFADELTPDDLRENMNTASGWAAYSLYKAVVRDYELKSDQ